MLGVYLQAMVTLTGDNGDNSSACDPGDIQIARLGEIRGGSTAEKRTMMKGWAVNPGFVTVQMNHGTLNMRKTDTWATVL